MSKENDKKVEQRISELLASDEQDRANVEDEALNKLLPRYEIRIQAQFDPVAEETKQYRTMAKEIDDRYSEYDEVNEDAQNDQSSTEDK